MHGRSRVIRRPGSKQNGPGVRKLLAVEASRALGQQAIQPEAGPRRAPRQKAVVSNAGKGSEAEHYGVEYSQVKA